MSKTVMLPVPVEVIDRLIAMPEFDECKSLADVAIIVAGILANEYDDDAPEFAIPASYEYVTREWLM